MSLNVPVRGLCCRARWWIHRNKLLSLFFTQIHIDSWQRNNLLYLSGHKGTTPPPKKPQQHCPQQNKQVKYDMTAAQVAVSPVEPAHDQTWIITDRRKKMAVIPGKNKNIPVKEPLGLSAEWLKICHTRFHRFQFCSWERERERHVLMFGTTTEWEYFGSS